MIMLNCISATLILAGALGFMVSFIGLALATVLDSSLLLKVFTVLFFTSFVALLLGSGLSHLI